MALRLRSRVLLTLVVTMAVVGGAATLTVVRLGEDRALALARTELGAEASQAAEGVGASLRALREGAALLAYVRTEADVARGPGVGDAQAREAEASLEAWFREASAGPFARVAVLGPEGGVRQAWARGQAEAPATAPAEVPSWALAALRADPAMPPVAWSGEGAVVVAAALADARGAYSGMVRAEAPLAALLPAPGGETWLADAGGLRIAGAAPWPEAAAALARGAAGRGGSASEAAGGWLYAAAPVPGAPHMPGEAGPWVLVRAVPEAAATAPAAGPALALAAALAGVAAASALAAAASVSRSLRPVERLAAAVGSLGRGPPGGRVEPAGPRELRALAEGFNAMVERLAEREAAMQREAATRARHAKDATLGRLSAGLAHEIKNPLTGMRLQLDLARARLARFEASAPGPEGRAFAEAARSMMEVSERGLARIEGLAASLGQLSRPRPEVRAVEVGPVAEASVALAGARLRGRAEVRVEVPPGLRVLASPDALGQVLLNLVANAAEAVPEGRGRIAVTGVRRGDRVVLAVEDNGPGVPPEVAARLGEPFLTTKPHGTGLGLAISMRAASEMGGGLRLAGAPGGGARFELDLPAAPGPPSGPAGRPAGPGGGQP